MKVDVYYSKFLFYMYNSSEEVNTRKLNVRIYSFIKNPLNYQVSEYSLILQGHFRIAQMLGSLCLILTTISIYREKLKIKI